MSPMQSYNLDISVREDSQGNGRTLVQKIIMEKVLHRNGVIKQVELVMEFKMEELFIEQ